MSDWMAVWGPSLIIALSSSGGIIYFFLTWLKQRGREPLEQTHLVATSDLTIAQAAEATATAKEVAERIEITRLERAERMWEMVESLRERVTKQEHRIGELSADLDVERTTRLRQLRAVQKAVAARDQYIAEIRAAWPTPPPPMLPEWDDYPAPHEH